MQETQVQSLVWEISTCRGATSPGTTIEPAALEPGSSSYWSPQARALQQACAPLAAAKEKPAQRPRPSATSKTERWDVLKITSHCGFDLHFSSYEWGQTSFLMLRAREEFINLPSRSISERKKKKNTLLAKNFFFESRWFDFYMPSTSLLWGCSLCPTSHLDLSV